MKLYFNGLLICTLLAWPLKASNQDKFEGQTPLQRSARISEQYYHAQLEEARDYMQRVNPGLLHQRQEYLQQIVRIKDFLLEQNSPIPVRKLLLGSGVLLLATYLDIKENFYAQILYTIGLCDLFKNIYKVYKKTTYEREFLILCDKFISTFKSEWPTPQYFQAHLMNTCLENIDYKKYLPEEHEPALKEVSEGVHMALGNFINLHKRAESEHQMQEITHDNAHQYYEIFAAWGIIRHKDIDVYYNKMFGEG